MKRINTKIVAVALGAALSATCLLGGLMLNNSAITASADENDGIMTVAAPPAPSSTAVSEYGVVQYTYTATNCGIMQLSNTTSFSDRIIVTAESGAGKATYKEVKIPTVGSTTTVSTYRYARSAAQDEDGDWDYSETASVYTAKNADNAVRTALTSGTTSTLYYTTYDLSVTDGESLYITFAYAGEYISYTNYYQAGQGYGDLRSVTLGGVTVYFKLKAGNVQIRTTKKVTLSDNPNSEDGTGAIVFALKQ